VRKFLAVIEETGTGYSAYSPDLPGCVSTDHTREEIERNMREAIDFHLEGMRLEGMDVRDPISTLPTSKCRRSAGCRWL